MTNKQRHFCLAEVDHYSDRDSYISDLALSSVWGDLEGAAIPGERIAQLEQLWDAYHRPVKDIAAAAGMTHRQLSERFFIPIRTVDNWCASGSNHRECPVYVRLMMQEILKLDPSDD